MSVFADDFVMDTTESGGGVVTGGDACIAFLQETIGDVVTVHHGHMPEIDADVADDRDRHLGDGGHAPLAERHRDCTATGTTTRPTKRSTAPGASQRSG